MSAWITGLLEEMEAARRLADQARIEVEFRVPDGHVMTADLSRIEGGGERLLIRVIGPALQPPGM